MELVDYSRQHLSVAATTPAGDTAHSDHTVSNKCVTNLELETNLDAKICIHMFVIYEQFTTA